MFSSSSSYRVVGHTVRRYMMSGGSCVPASARFAMEENSMPVRVEDPGTCRYTSPRGCADGNSQSWNRPDDCAVGVEVVEEVPHDVARDDESGAGERCALLSCSRRCCHWFRSGCPAGIKPPAYPTCPPQASVFAGGGWLFCSDMASHCAAVGCPAACHALAFMFGDAEVLPSLDSFSLMA